jgi:hypothetical protein
MKNKLEKVLAIAVSALYFDGGGRDATCALWDIVSEVNSDAADLLGDDEEAAYKKYAKDKT